MYNCYTPRVAHGGEAAGDSGGGAKAKKKEGPTPRGVGDKQRAGGRAWNQFRPLFLDVDVVSQASGSAYMELEHTKVICAVYGPKPRQDVEFSEQGKILCDFRYAPFARAGVRRERAGLEEEERALSLLVAQALEASVQLARLPKSVVEVYVMVLQADGGELGAAISCASLALATAGVDLYGLVAACAVLTNGSDSGSTGSTGSRDGNDAPALLLDPTSQEEQERGRAAGAAGDREEQHQGGAQAAAQQPKQKGSKRSRTAAVLTKGEDGGEGRRAGLLHLALMPASGEVTQLKQEGVFATKERMEAALELATDGARMLHAMMRRRLLKTLQLQEAHQQEQGEG